MVKRTSPFFTSAPSLKCTSVSTPVTCGRISTRSTASRRPEKLLQSMIFLFTTSATSTGTPCTAAAGVSALASPLRDNPKAQAVTATMPATASETAVRLLLKFSSRIFMTISLGRSERCVLVVMQLAAQEVGGFREQGFVFVQVGVAHIEALHLRRYAGGDQ